MSRDKNYYTVLILLTIHLILLSLILTISAIVLIFSNKNFISDFFDPTGFYGTDTFLQNIYLFYKQPKSYIFLCPSFMLVSHFIIRASTKSLNYYITLVFLTIHLILLSIPILTGAIILLCTNKIFSMTFFEPAGIGDPGIHFQNLCWFYKQPKSYIFLCPSFMLISHFIIRASIKSLSYYVVLSIIWLLFIFLMSLSAHARLIDTYSYILCSFVLLYIIYVYMQL